MIRFGNSPAKTALFCSLSRSDFIPKDFYRSGGLVLVFLTLSLAEIATLTKLPVGGAPAVWGLTTID
jgi:hypothetical protein